MRLNINEVMEISGLSRKSLSKVLGITANQSLYHWLERKDVLNTATDELPPEVEKNIELMSDLITWALVRHDGGKKMTKKWFRTRNPGLRKKMKPRDFLVTDGGLQELERFLRSAE